MVPAFICTNKLPCHRAAYEDLEPLFLPIMFFATIMESTNHSLLKTRSLLECHLKCFDAYTGKKPLKTMVLDCVPEMSIQCAHPAYLAFSVSMAVGSFSIFNGIRTMILALISILAVDAL